MKGVIFGIDERPVIMSQFIYGSYKVQEILSPLFTKQKGLLSKEIRKKLTEFGWIQP